MGAQIYVLLRYGCHRGGMIGVMLGQGMVPVLLLTVHGHVHPIVGAGAIVGGPCGSPSCLRVPRVPRARR
jgi:hypothetical protein